MKTYIITIFWILMTAQFAMGQSFNLVNTSSEVNQMAYVSFGLEYSMSTRLAYAHRAKTQGPVWVLVDISVPKGTKILDDFKTRLGAQVIVKSVNKFALSTRVQANYRQYQQELVTMKSFGGEITAILGRYNPKWAIEAELGFDKAIATHLNHTELFKDNYSKVSDGWYVPTGGNWHYGFTVGRSLGSMMQISLSIGTTNAQGNDVDGLIPYYMHLAFSKSF